jgi:hypothetical protein
MGIIVMDEFPIGTKGLDCLILRDINSKMEIWQYLSMCRNISQSLRKKPNDKKFHYSQGNVW